MTGKKKRIRALKDEKQCLVDALQKIASYENEDPSIVIVRTRQKYLISIAVQALQKLETR